MYTCPGDSIRALRVIQKLLDQPEALTDRQASTIADTVNLNLHSVQHIDSEADREVETGREADTDTDTEAGTDTNTRDIDREADTDRQIRQTDKCVCVISCFVG